MGVFERRRRSGTVYYVSFVWNGHQVQERAGTDKRQALQLERQRKREVRDGTYRADKKSGSTTLVNYLDGWLQARRVRGIRTVADDEARLRMHVVPLIRHQTPRQHHPQRRTRRSRTAAFGWSARSQDNPQRLRHTSNAVP